MKSKHIFADEFLACWVVCEKSGVIEGDRDRSVFLACMHPQVQQALLKNTWSDQRCQPRAEQGNAVRKIGPADAGSNRQFPPPTDTDKHDRYVRMVRIPFVSNGLQPLDDIVDQSVGVRCVSAIGGVCSRSSPIEKSHLITGIAEVVTRRLIPPGMTLDSVQKRQISDGSVSVGFPVVDAHSVPVGSHELFGDRVGKHIGIHRFYCRLERMWRISSTGNRLLLQREVLPVCECADLPSERDAEFGCGDPALSVHWKDVGVYKKCGQWVIEESDEQALMGSQH